MVSSLLIARKNSSPSIFRRQVSSRISFIASLPRNWRLQKGKPRLLLRHLPHGFYLPNDGFAAHVRSEPRQEDYPSGFLSVSGGNIRRHSLSEVYQTSLLFVALREADNLKGKCGVCEFREICGGSRTRAYALTGDAFAPEPCCRYNPRGWLEERATR